MFSAFLYFLAMAFVIPVLPKVVNELFSGSKAVRVVFVAFQVSYVEVRRRPCGFAQVLACASLIYTAKRRAISVCAIRSISRLPGDRCSLIAGSRTRKTRDRMGLLLLCVRSVAVGASLSLSPPLSPSLSFDLVEDFGTSPG